MQSTMGINKAEALVEMQHHNHRKQIEDERRVAFIEDLAEWIGDVLSIPLRPKIFLTRIENGVILCHLARKIHTKEVSYRLAQPALTPTRKAALEALRPPGCNAKAPKGSFFARDNLVSFRNWCIGLGYEPRELFEPSDLIEGKAISTVLKSLMGIARQCHGKVPKFIELEREIDQEIRTTPPPPPLAEPAPAPCQPPRDELSSFIEDLEARYGIRMIRVKKGQYKVGDATKSIFVRLLRSHVVVRVGGGWDTLEHYLATHERANAVIGSALSSASHPDAASMLREHAVDEFHDPEKSNLFTRNPQPLRVQSRDAFGMAKRGVSPSYGGPAAKFEQRGKRLSAGEEDASSRGSAAATMAGVAAKPAASPGARQTPPSSPAAGANSTGRKKPKKGSERRASVDTMGRRHPFLSHGNGNGKSPVGVTVGRSHPFLASPSTATGSGRSHRGAGATPEMSMASNPRRRVSAGGSGFAARPKSARASRSASAQSSPVVASRRRSGPIHGRGHPFLDSPASQNGSPRQTRPTRQRSEEPQTARSDRRKERSKPWAEASPAAARSAVASPRHGFEPEATGKEISTRDACSRIDGIEVPLNTTKLRDTVVAPASAPTSRAAELTVGTAATVPEAVPLPLRHRGAADYPSSAREVWYQLRQGSIPIGDEDCIQLTTRTLTVRNLKLGVCESRKGAVNEDLHPVDLTVFCNGTHMKPRERFIDLEAVYDVQLPRASVVVPSAAAVEPPAVPVPTLVPSDARVLDRLDWAAAPEVALAVDDDEIAALLRKIEIAENEARRLAVP